MKKHYGRPYSRIHAHARNIMVGAIALVSFGLFIGQTVHDYMYPNPAKALSITGYNVPEPYRLSIDELITLNARKYNISERYARCIIRAESSYNPGAVGDNGKAVGIVQFHLPTWRSFRKKMGQPQTDTRFVASDALNTFFWALSKGYDRHWSPVVNGICKK